MATRTRRRFTDKKMGHMHASARAGKSKRMIRKIGFYGCNNRVVRVALSEPPGPGKHYPLKVTLQCPACTHEHDAQPLWREYRPSLDDGKDTVIV